MPLGDKKVNLFIVGAAKCATTSLYYYLSQHPDICFSNIKEPRYFSSKYYKFPHCGVDDIRMTDSNIIKSFETYSQLFTNYNSQKIIAEASVDYLYTYQCAIDIYNYNPEAKIIIILRNPVSRAFSHYNHLVRDGRETETFEHALELEEERINSNFEFSWHYKKVGLYCNQVEQYLRIFGEKQVEILIYEDFLQNIYVNCERIINFLDIEFDKIKNLKFSKLNVSGKPNFAFISKFLNSRYIFFDFLKRWIPKSKGILLKSYINRMNLSNTKIDYKEQKNLASFFEHDIRKLELLLGRDLREYWY